MLKWIRSEWPLLAVWSVIALLLGVALLARDNIPSDRAEHRQHTEAENGGPNAESIGQHEGLAQDNRRHSSDENDAKDFILQWDAEEIIAIGTLGLFAVTALLFVATFLLWLTTAAALRRQGGEFKVSLRESIKSNKIAQDHIAASHRPWLRMTASLKAGLKWTDAGIPISIEFRVDNIGAAPAMNIMLHPKVVIDLDWATTHRTEVNLTKINAPDRFGYMLFPTEHFTQHHTMSISPEDVLTYNEAMSSMGSEVVNPPIFPVITGCLTYRTPIDGRAHVTAFAYRIGRRPPGPPGLLPSGFVPRSVDLPEGSVGFARDIVGFWAD